MTMGDITKSWPGQSEEIRDIWAFIAQDEEGEGLAAFLTPMGTWMPMVTHREERLEMFRGVARRIASDSSKKIVLRRFTLSVDLEVFEP